MPFMSLARRGQKNLKTQVLLCEERIKLFSRLHYRPEEFRNARITGHVRFVYEENLGQGIHMII